MSQSAPPLARWARQVAAAVAQIIWIKKGPKKGAMREIQTGRRAE